MECSIKSRQTGGNVSEENIGHLILLLKMLRGRVSEYSGKLGNIFKPKSRGSKLELKENIGQVAKEVK